MVYKIREYKEYSSTEAQTLKLLRGFFGFANVNGTKEAVEIRAKTLLCLMLWV